MAVLAALEKTLGFPGVALSPPIGGLRELADSVRLAVLAVSENTRYFGGLRLPAPRSLDFPCQLVGQVVGVVHLPQRLDDRPAIDRHRPGHVLVVDEVEHQRLDVAVEDQADDLGVLVDDRAAASCRR